MLPNKKKFVALLSFLAFVFLSGPILSEANDESVAESVASLELIEAKTGLSGWRYQGECHGTSERGAYKVMFYSPPRWKDVGGYGILTTKYNNRENIYSGYEFYSYAGGNGCDFIESCHDGDLLILHTENWSLMKRYVISVDVPSGKVLSYSYDLKNTEIYRTKLNNNSYLIAGFGVCETSKGGNWVSDIFCADVSVDTYKKSKAYLKNSMGLTLTPEILATGKGVFKYYVLTVGEEKYDQNLVDEKLLDYFGGVADIVKLLEGRGSKNDYYNSLLAIDSIRLESPDLWQKLKNKKLISEDAVPLEEAFRHYWEIVFQSR